MTTTRWKEVSPDIVLDFWFPDNGHDASLETHRDFWVWRMRGGADEAICSDFADLTEAAARGLLDRWAQTSYGRLALVIALDQFPRSLWRGTPGAYAQDIKAARLVLEAFENGHYEALKHPWEKQFCLISIGHCEGPDHLERMRMLRPYALAILEEAPKHLIPSYRRSLEQNDIVTGVIERFGRHPHRNAILGRISTADEEAYIAAGEFPHEREIPKTLI